MGALKGFGIVIPDVSEVADTSTADGGAIACTVLVIV